MKQFDLFGEEIKSETIYATKIQIPTYEPKNICPHPLELYDDSKTKRLVNEIENSNLTYYEKEFLIKSAHRHVVFNYQKIADYYSHATPEMQKLMERSALVIIDFESAIEYGFVRLSNEIANEYLNDYSDDEKQ